MKKNPAQTKIMRSFLAWKKTNRIKCRNPAATGLAACAIATALLLSPAQAQPVNNWTGPAEGYWSFSSPNDYWSSNHTPTASEEARINGASVNLGPENGVAARLVVGHDGSSASLLIKDGGSLSTTMGSFIGIGGTGSVTIDEGAGHEPHAHWDNSAALHIGMAGSGTNYVGNGELRLTALGTYHSTGTDGIILGGFVHVDGVDHASRGSIHIGGPYQGAPAKEAILNTPRILGAPTGAGGGPNFLTFNHTATTETNPYYFTRNALSNGPHIDIGLTNWANIQVIHASGHTVLSGSNAYAAGTSITGGVLEITQQSTLGVDVFGNGIHLDGGTLRIAGTEHFTTSQAVTLGGAGGTLDVVDESVYLTLNATLSGSSTLTKKGDGTLEFHGGALLSNLIMEKGNVSLTGGHSVFQSVMLHTGTALAVPSPATVEFVSLTGQTNSALLSGGGTEIIVRAGNFGGMIGGALLEKTTSENLTVSGTFSQSTVTVEEGSLTMHGPITANSIITVNAGLAQITGPNSSGGTVTVGGGETIISGAMSDKSGNEKTKIIQNGGVLLLTSGHNTFTGGLTINGGRTDVGTGEPGPVNTGSFGDGPITIGATGSLVYYLDVDTLLLGPLGGSGMLETARQGKVIFSGADTFSGALKLTAGGVNLNMMGADMTISSLDGEASGVLDLGENAARTLHLNQSGNTSFNGGISGSGNFRKLGAGTLVLAGDITHTGNTEVAGGTLNLANGGQRRFVIGGNGTNNALTGSGTTVMDGKFAFDLSGASTNIGDSWTIVAATLSNSYGINFAVHGFNGSGGSWTNNTNGVGYVFTQSSGVLTVQAAVTNNYESWTGYWQGVDPGFTNTAGTADPDGDGFSNDAEFTFGSNPTVGSPALMTATESGGNVIFNFVVRKNPPGGVSYEVQGTTNLATEPWTGPVAVTISNSADQTGIPIPADYERKEFTVPGTNNQFFRVEAIMP